MTNEAKPNIPEVFFGFLLAVGMIITQPNVIVAVVSSFVLAVYIAKEIKGLSWKEFQHQLYTEIRS